MDFIGKDGAHGQLAGYMASQGRLDPGHMRPFVGADGRAYVTVYSGGDPKKKESYKTVPIQTNATLRRDEWKTLDEAVMAISRTRLSGIQDLIDNNLVYSLGNAMGTTVLEWHSMHDAMEAALTMDGVTRGQGDRITYETNYLPIPIIHVDYEINSRVLAASRSLGNPLDTSSAEAAARKVAEKLENMLFTNETYAFGGGTIYSYLNHPNRNLATLGTAWTSDTAANILADVFTMKQASIDAKHYGPWMLYIPVAYEVMLDKDYDADYPGTIRERILKIDGIKGIKVVDTLPAGNVLLVQMTSDVVRLVRGMGVQNVEWQTEGKFINKYKVMTIQVPQVRSDADGNSGIVHLS
jgi:uncharacterized linocin/CFP29 family protein